MSKFYTLHAVQLKVDEGKINEQTGRIVVPVKTKTIAAGKVVDLDPDVAKSLMAEEAVRVATREEIAIAKDREDEAEEAQAAALAQKTAAAGTISKAPRGA